MELYVSVRFTHECLFSCMHLQKVHRCLQVTSLCDLLAWKSMMVYLQGLLLLLVELYKSRKNELWLYRNTLGLRYNDLKHKWKSLFSKNENTGMLFTINWSARGTHVEAFHLDFENLGHLLPLGTLDFHLPNTYLCFTSKGEAVKCKEGDTLK